MADLTQTAADVRTASNAVTELVQAGEAITAGQPLYQKSSDEKYYKADADAGQTEAGATVIALMNADQDGYLIVQSEGDVNVGATTVKGEVYVVSNTAGNIAPASDLASGWYPTVIGTAKDTAGVIELDFHIGSANKT